MHRLHPYARTRWGEYRVEGRENTHDIYHDLRCFSKRRDIYHGFGDTRLCILALAVPEVQRHEAYQKCNNKRCQKAWLRLTRRTDPRHRPMGEQWTN
jgi:hypothetical protein